MYILSQIRLHLHKFIISWYDDNIIFSGKSDEVKLSEVDPFICLSFCLTVLERSIVYSFEIMLYGVV